MCDCVVDGATHSQKNTGKGLCMRGSRQRGFVSQPADRLLSGLGQPQINPYITSDMKKGVKVFVMQS